MANVSSVSEVSFLVSDAKRRQEIAKWKNECLMPNGIFVTETRRKHRHGSRSRSKKRERVRNRGFAWGESKFRVVDMPKAERQEREEPNEPRLDR